MVWEGKRRKPYYSARTSSDGERLYPDEPAWWLLVVKAHRFIRHIWITTWYRPLGYWRQVNDTGDVVTDWRWVDTSGPRVYNIVGRCRAR